MAHLFKRQNPHFKIDKFLDTALIKITEVGGSPLAFVLGKEFISYKFLHKRKKILGFTLQLNDDLWNFIKGIQLSYLEINKKEVLILQENIKFINNLILSLSDAILALNKEIPPVGVFLQFQNEKELVWMGASRFFQSLDPLNREDIVNLPLENRGMGSDSSQGSFSQWTTVYTRVLTRNLSLGVAFRYNYYFDVEQEDMAIMIYLTHPFGDRRKKTF